MKAERLKLYLIIAGALLFNWLFWNEKMAINTVLYDFFLLGVLFSLYPNARHSSTVRWLLAGHLICLAMIVVHNTELSKLAYSITLLITIGFVQYAHRSVWYAAGSIAQNMLFAVPGFFELMERPKSNKRGGLSKMIRFAFIPLALTMVFFVMYALANSIFSDIVSRIAVRIERYFSGFFDFFSPGRLFFFLFGLFITTFLLLKSKLNYFSKKEESLKDKLVRSKKTLAQRQQDGLYGIVVGIMGKLASGIMALKNINTIGILSLAVLNILLVLINSIDIAYIWFGFKPMEVNLYKVIHEGTNILILSILLAILVLLIFFRGNLNFYQRNKWLKRLAYIWVIQNSILVISVFLRDYYYIREAGLGRNRIGILFYLAMVLFGLGTVYWKIYRQKTTYYLFRINAWAAIVLLVVSTTVNWDKLIVRYNLSRKNEIVMPVMYMVSLSDKVLPMLYENKEELQRHEKLMKANGFWDDRDCDGCWKEILDNRIRRFGENQRSYTWLSWNKADNALSTYFKTSTTNN